MNLILRRLYYQMLRIRLVEEKIAELYPEQEMRCPVHLCVGQEASAAGVCEALEADDLVFSGHRSHGHYLAKGGDLRAMIAELYGKATGCSKGKGGSMHLVDLRAGFMGSAPIVGSTIPIAVGSAFASFLKGERGVTAVFFGEGALEEGVFHESMNFASLKKLPVLFVCENNLYSVYSPLGVRQPAGRPVTALASAHGVQSVSVDGNDAEAVYDVALRAARRLRSGAGPFFMELLTYRWREHCGPYYDNDLGYRSPSEFLEWQKKCPLARLEKRLVESSLLTAQEMEEMRRKISREIEEAFGFAQKSPFPSPAELLEDVYAA